MVKIKIADGTIQSILETKVDVNSQLRAIIENSLFNINKILYDGFVKYTQDNATGKTLYYEAFLDKLDKMKTNKIIEQLHILDLDDHFTAEVDGNYIDIYVDIIADDLYKYILNRI